MKRYIRFLFKFFVLTTLLSCTSTVDFDQLNHIEIDQNLSSSFIYLNINQNNFLDGNTSAEISSFTSVSAIDIFDYKYFQDNLITANFSFEIENTFNRAFEIEISFLKGDDSVTESFNINVPSENNLVHIENYEGLDLIDLKLSEQLKVTVHLQPSSDSSTLTNDIEMALKIKSVVNFILKIN